MFFKCAFPHIPKVEMLKSAHLNSITKWHSCVPLCTIFFFFPVEQELLWGIGLISV